MAKNYLIADKQQLSKKYNIGRKTENIAARSSSREPQSDIQFSPACAGCPNPVDLSTLSLYGISNQQIYIAY